MVEFFKIMATGTISLLVIWLFMILCAGTIKLLEKSLGITPDAIGITVLFFSIAFLFGLVIRSA